MQALYNYKEYAVLLVDDEELTLKYFERNFKSTFDVLTASSASDAQKILSEQGDRIGVILSDQRMPEISGTEFLESVRKNYPDCIRILITAYADMDATIAAINNGAVYKYLSKPYEDLDLEITVKRALEFYIIQKERNALLREKIGAMHRSVLTERVLSMGVLSAGISHHVRNSLTAVRAFLDLAPEKLKSEGNPAQINDPAFWHDLYEAAQSQVSQIVEMLKGVECYSTITETKFSDNIDVADALKVALENKASELKAAGIDLSLSDLEENLQMTGNKKLLHQAFEMLFKDAVCFMPTGKKLQLEMARQADCLTISLNGLSATTGVNDIIPLFDPFHINNEKPSEPGVHLLGAFFLIYHHGGVIDLEKCETDMKKMTIRLPLDANDPLLPSTEQDFMQKVFRLQHQWEDHLLST
ncbi:MAG: response regulator [Verrucomicrobiota bacterium]